MQNAIKAESNILADNRTDMTDLLFPKITYHSSGKTILNHKVFTDLSVRYFNPYIFFSI
jgi:hypothetical protein